MPTCHPSLSVAAKTASVFSDENLLRLAKATGLLRRRTAKLSPKVLLGSCLATVGAARSSFFSLAGFAGLFAHRAISRQGVALRFGEPLQEFLRGVLAQLMGAHQAAPETLLPAQGPVRRILIADSTTLPLHPSLAEHFPGSANASGRGAALKIQGTLDLLGHRFVDFSLSGFTRNDQAAAADVLAHVRPGDVILRDLGYLTTESLRGIELAGAFFVSRYSKMNVLRTDGVPLALGALLLGSAHAPGACVDVSVLLGQSARLPARLVAVKLDAAIARQRRRKALANRDGRCKPSAESLALLDWAIYVTNLPAEGFQARKISALYALRWRVEIVFKSFKSAGWRLSELLTGTKSKAQVEVLAHAALILAVLGAHLMGAPLPLQKPHIAPRAACSLLQSVKLMSLLLLPLILRWLTPPTASLSPNVLRALHDRARYDTRRRRNYIQNLTQTLALT